MKAIVKYTLIGFLFVSINSSCKKGWLDVTASNQIKADDQFKEAAGFKDALMGAYIGMTAQSSYGRDMTWNLVDLLSRQYNTLGGGNTYIYAQNFEYERITVKPILDALWNKQYNTIANLNNALNYLDVDKGVLNSIEYGIIKGELLGLRAFLHFDLIRLYGHGNYANRPELANRKAIPYVTQYSKDITPQLTYQQTFALLEKDLEEALELLKEDPIYPNASRNANYYSDVNRNGFYNSREQRMNYFAVKALKARVLLWEGGAENIGKAAVIAEEVISQSQAHLITANTDVTKHRTFPTEHLFGLKIEAFPTIINPYLTGDVSSQVGLYIVNTTAEEMYEADDANIGLVDIRYNNLLVAESRGRVPVKLKPDPAFLYGLIPLMKIPEMYYIAAEHYINTNPNKAVDLINAVRKSRRILSDIPYGLSTDLLQAELLKEYRKEYVMEGQLFFYYKRIGLKHIPGLSQDFIVGDGVYTIPYPDNEIEFGNRVQ